MDSVPWAAAGGFMSKYGPKNGGWHVWVNLGDLALWGPALWGV